MLNDSNGFLKALASIIVCLSSFNVEAQLTDLARLEYSFIPKSDSDDEYNRFRGSFNIPMETSEDCYFVIGAEYNRIILELEDTYPFNKSELQRIHIADVNLAYTFKTNEHWRLGLKFSPRVASTLTGSFSMDDVFLNGGVFAIEDRRQDKTLKRPYRLILGLTYNSTTGLPFPLPFISYYRQVNERWSFNLGVPKINLKRYINEKNSVQAFFSIDGYYAHIQNRLLIDGQEAKHVSLSAIVAGLGYEYAFTKHLVAYAYTGYTLRLSNTLRDDNRDKLFNLDDVNAFYLRTGIKFKI